MENKNELQILEHENQRVLTTQQLAKSYETDNKSISYNFNHNKDRYIEGKHYYLLKGKDLKAFREIHDLPNNLNKVYLWTERGAFLHAKSLNTDKAWEVYESLVEHYFKTKQNPSYSLPMTYKEALIQLVEQVEKNEKLELKNKKLEDDNRHKEDVIIGLIDDIDLTEKRRRITEIVRKGNSNFQDRYTKLYKEFEMKYHINLNQRLKSWNEKNMKPTAKTKMDYIDKVMGKIPELYEICCKLYENDIHKLVDQMYGLGNQYNDVTNSHQ